MSGTIDFREYDLQNPGFTGFSFLADIFGSGIADISLFSVKQPGNTKSPEWYTLSNLSQSQNRQR